MVMLDKFEDSRASRWSEISGGGGGVMEVRLERGQM